MTNDNAYPQPDHFIVHISDTHFVEHNGLLNDAIDCDAQLAALLRSLIGSKRVPDAIIFSGDIADTGSPSAYRRIRAMVDPMAEAIGTRVIWVMGNHDERAAFRSELLGEKLATDQPYNAVFELDGLRIIVLDTTVPGQHWGELGDTQLDWLRRQLDTPARHGTLLAMHHPPVPSPIDLLRFFELRDQARLAAVIRETDVRAILAGHLHYTTSDTFAGIPVLVSSATCYTQDLDPAEPTARGQDGGQSFNLVHVYPEHVQSCVVPIGQFPTTYELNADDVKNFLALSPEEQLAAVSNRPA